MAFRTTLTPLSSGRALRGLTPLLDLHRDMNRLFEGAFRDADGQSGLSAFAPRLDVHETQDDLCLAMDLPGVAEADVDLRVEGDVLIIAGERKQADQSDGRTWHITERRWGRFERSLKLPFAPDASQVRAAFDNGVLTIQVPKAAVQEKGRRIQIGAAKTSSAESNANAPAIEENAKSESDKAINKASRKPEAASY